MSATKAAASLIANDPTIAEQVRVFIEEGYTHDERREAIEALLRDVIGTWTLTLAAEAGGVTEEQVIAAMAYHPCLRVGSTNVAQSVARRLFQSH